MTCEEASILLHALIDGELDAGHTREVEAHIAVCPSCTTALCEFRQLRTAMASASLLRAAPATLRQRIEAGLPARRTTASSRRDVMKGLAIGAAATALAASGVIVAVMRTDDQQRILGEVVSAHLRSLQAPHLIDVQSSDQHTVKPWFNGRVDVAPPVVDLTAQGFTLLGGRVDYVDARPVAVVVYRRRAHVINLFCEPSPGTASHEGTMKGLRGFNVLQWIDEGIALRAVSDISPGELAEFGRKFQAARRQ